METLLAILAIYWLAKKPATSATPTPAATAPDPRVELLSQYNITKHDDGLFYVQEGWPANGFYGPDDGTGVQLQDGIIIN